MPRPFRLSLTLRLLTPLSSGAAGAGAVLADKTVVRNGLGEYILPGSQVRGTLRHACERLLRTIAPEGSLCNGPRPDQMCPQVASPNIRTVADPYVPNGRIRCCPLCAVFGSPYFPSPLQFHDLLCANPLRGKGPQPYKHPNEARLGQETIRPMVSLNRRRGVAEAQRLFFIETTPAQQHLTFSNAEAVVGTLESIAQAKLLLAGLRLLVSLGGGRSRGLGWIAIEELSAWLDEQQVTADGWEALRELYDPA